MPAVRFLVAMMVAALIAVAPHAAAQPFPSKPVRIITPFPPGSGPDTVLRIIGEKLSNRWGQSVIVENRPGANGFIAIEAAKKAPADGYTLVQMDDAHQSLQPHLYKKIPYDTVKDFDPVATLYRTYFFVVVPATSPWKNMPDLIDAAKQKPGQLTYGSWFVGSPGHLGAAHARSRDRNADGARALQGDVATFQRGRRERCRAGRSAAPRRPARFTRPAR